MTELTQKRCVPCEGGVPALGAEETLRLMAQLSSEWRLVEDGKALRRELRCGDFFRAMSFANAVAHIANVEDHHPDLEVGYGYCRVRFSTHAIGGLSENDFICAAKVDAIPLR